MAASNFVRLVGDGIGGNGIHITTVSGAGLVAVPLSGAPFDTSMRAANESAMLVCSVLNMVGTAEVHINGTLVGSITPSGTHWSTFMIGVDGNVLNNGNTNQMTLKEVTDEFELKSVYCFFHQ